MKNDKVMKRKFIDDIYKEKPVEDASFDEELAKL
jgi:hypothetical protein